MRSSRAHARHDREEAAKRAAAERQQCRASQQAIDTMATTPRETDARAREQIL